MVARDATDEPKAPRFRIEASLFGGFGVEIDGSPIKPVGSKIARSMFAQLLYLNDRHHMRSRLAGTFWPDSDETTARKRLSRTLWQIRTACDPYPIIEAQHDWIAISSDSVVSVDVLDYEDLLSTTGEHAGRDELQNLARAVDLYRGDFMAGHYEPWVTEEQDRLRLLQQASLRRLVTQYQSRGSLEPALIAARRLVHIEPWDEAAHRQVMRLCVLLRRPEEALRQFRECRSILSSEMDMEPSPETVDLAEEVHAQLASASVSRPKRQQMLAPVFVAREAERDLMIDALDRSLGGNGSVILLEGPGGIGKSSLVSQISDDARWRNIEVLDYSYDDTTSTGAFQSIREAVGPAITPLRAEQLAESLDDVWLAEAARIVPTVGRARRELTAAQMTGDDERWRIREAIAQVLLALARLQPTLLVLEDVHWADTDTLEVVERLASAIGDAALVVCLAFRREEAMARDDTWRSLTQIDRLPSSRRVTLGELRRDDVVRLVTALGGPVDSAEALADRLLEHAGGNPLFVVETVKGLLVDNGQTGIESIPRDMPLASNVTELVRRRLDRLDANALAVVSATSVFGRPAGVDELVALTKMERREVLAGLASAVQTHVLLDEESGCVFSHNLVKRVVYDSIVWNRRAKLHRRTGDLLSGVSAPAAEVAHHKREGKQWLDAMRFSQMAGDEARAVGAYLVAAEHYERAMDAASEIDVDSSELSSLLEAYEVVADVIGERDLQDHLLAAMGEVAEEGRARVTFHQRNALFLAKTDEFDAALAAVAKGMEAAEDNDLARWELATIQAQIYEWSGDAVRAAETLTPLVEQIDDDRTKAEALFTLGGALAGTMQYREAQIVLRQSLEHFVSTGEKWAEVRIRILLATVLSQIGLEQQADRTLLAAVETARSIGY
ncbi:MAG: AAA family ATPase, partial [Acidimicrobiia bacterium]|nr:AAA family ATPase [Acidimicrobiia bacterium]